MESKISQIWQPGDFNYLIFIPFLLSKLIAKILPLGPISNMVLLLKRKYVDKFSKDFRFVESGTHKYNQVSPDCEKRYMC